LLAAAAFLIWIAILAIARSASLSGRLLNGAPPRYGAILGDWHTSLRLSGYAVLVFAWVWMSRHTPVIVDARVYSNIDLAHLYGKGPNEVGAYLYSPAFAQLVAPFSLLDWRTFYSVWTGLDLVAMAWLLGPIAAALSLGFPLVAHQVWVGNIPIFLAVATVIAMRHAAAWPLLILTKVTPAVGLIYLAARGEWRSVVIAIAATLVVIAISFVVAPQLWIEWSRLLIAGAGASNLPQGLLPLGLGARVALAAVVAAAGGFFGRPWAVPIAIVLAQPIFWTIGLTTLFAVIPLSVYPRTQSQPPRLN
jgi:hypothetical protein